MPNYKTHNNLNTIFFILTSPVLFVDWRLFVGSVISYFASYYLSPDLDLAARKIKFLKKVYTDQVPHRYGLRASHWKNIKDNPWKVFFFSHIPLLGTVGRALPLSFLLFLPYNIWVYVFIFLVFYDIIHVTADLTKAGEGLYEYPRKNKKNKPRAMAGFSRKKSGYGKSNARSR